MNPYAGELIAVKEGLMFAIRLGFDKVVLEGDALNVISSITDNVEDRSYNGNILGKINLYSSFFRSFVCKAIPRHCNKVADALTNYANSIPLQNWLDRPRRFLAQMLVLDYHLV